jgi:hypothetical protein
MIVTIAWLSLAVAALVLESLSRRSTGLKSLGALGSRISSRRAGRLALVAVWALVGWHLFARYTIPPL